jgi:hypothetical protein
LELTLSANLENRSMSAHPHGLLTPRKALALVVASAIALGATPASALAGNGNGNGNGSGGANGKGSCDPTVSFCDTGRKNG